MDFNDDVGIGKIRERTMIWVCEFLPFFVMNFFQFFRRNFFFSSGFIVKCLSFGLKKMMKIVYTHVHDDGEGRRAEQSINEFQ
jgi:hypothetical protein